MTTATFTFSYPDLTGATSIITLKSGDVIFVLGSNGTGKTRLMTNLATQNQNKTKRILAHRQTWFNSNLLEYAPATQVRVQQNINNFDFQSTSSWMDNHHGERSQITLSNLIKSEGELAKRALIAVKSSNANEAEEIRNQETPIEALNHLLSLANLPIQISVEGDEKVFASKNNGPKYSIAQLSDGERNAVLIIADVLTAKPNTLFIIDEPERHLHRSIISPMLSSLFNKRKDCAFVVATHDIGLPLDNPQSSVLLIRGCKWQNENIIGWDTNLIPATQEIDYHVKQDILGSRRNILFVEGNETSLDKAIYSILYPEVSVIPQGDCKEVEKAVLGISSTQSLNWVKALGLIDADDRVETEIQALETKNIFALPYYSVESLYYSNAMIGKIAERQAFVRGINVDELISEALNAIITAIFPHKDRMCARVCERKIGAKLKSPTWKDIQSGGVFKHEITLDTVLSEEKAHFDSLIAAKDTDKLVGRYPVRQTEALTEVAKKLKFETREDYEGAVIKLLCDNQELRAQVRTSLGNLTTAIQT